MTKTELINAVATNANITKTAATEAVETMLETIRLSVKQGDRVELRGFGTFKRREQSAREGHNPRTKEPVSIPARTYLAFRASKMAFA